LSGKNKDKILYLKLSLVYVNFIKTHHCIITLLNRLGLGLGWVSTFMDCMFDTNNKQG